MKAAKHILFICSQNKLRSPTAEAVFCDYPDWEVRSAGLDKDARIPLGLDDIIWADYLFVMEKAHLNKLKKRFGLTALKNKKIICLGIPDEYDYMDTVLIKLLNQKVPQFIQ